MNSNSPILLIGVGGSGSAAVRGVSRAYGSGLRYVVTDTDASTGESDENFILIGGDRLSGRGAGGDFIAARMAAEDSVRSLDPSLENVRLAVVAASLGGGTGGGATLEILKHLSERGIPSIVFATTPFTFEGEDRQRRARGVMSMIEEAANATFFLPLDKLVGETDNMNEALRHAIDVLSSGITLFWRILEKPGYIRVDAERLRHLLSKAGRGRFAVISARGPDRVDRINDEMARSSMLAEGSGAVRAILCGILAGDDLRLSEVGKISDGVRSAFGNSAILELATVNDEVTFSGSISCVIMLFEANSKESSSDGKTASSSHGKKSRGPLSVGPLGRGRFNNAEPTIWHDEDLDIPTYLRRNINLDF